MNRSNLSQATKELLQNAVVQPYERNIIWEGDPRLTTAIAENRILGTVTSQEIKTFDAIKKFENQLIEEKAVQAQQGTIQNNGDSSARTGLLLIGFGFLAFAIYKKKMGKKSKKKTA